ncbi:DNA polymerase III subunit delta' [Snodgrassella sp. CFCC 13594]|uniref:DNA polymerase III subunit delta' n=1 Tax=Snodgrassella sp. CFCC 13594 TaxID=1775559 RepID=UPI0008367177|nr:DNA polymerase III subunit delta' [Snodgrassella sp. CFCC 13594]
MIYPWLQSIWQHIDQHWQQQPHAWLIHGHSGIGKRAFAEHLAQALLCEHSLAEHQPCGQCPSCHLFTQQSHPDFLMLTPPLAEDEANPRARQQIKVESVRAALAFAHLSSHRGGRRVILIYPAESMNTQAANALLKILEEPPADVMFILVSHNKDRLLPTIKSRCRQLALPMPSHEQAMAYLQQQAVPDADNQLAFHGGAPLFDESADDAALRENLLTILAKPGLIACMDYAAQFDRQKKPLALFLNWLHKWLLDVALAQRSMPTVYYPAWHTAIDTVAERTTSLALFALVQKLATIAPYGYHTLNVKMQLEDLFIAYVQFWQNKA